MRPLPSPSPLAGVGTDGTIVGGGAGIALAAAIAGTEARAGAAQQ